MDHAARKRIIDEQILTNSKHLFATFFLAALLAPYAIQYRQDHGTYLTPEMKFLLPVSFITCAVLYLLLIFGIKRHFAKMAAGISVLVLGLVSLRADAQRRCPTGSDDCGPRSMPVIPTPNPAAPPTLPPRTYMVTLTSGAGLRATLVENGTAHNREVIGIADNDVNAFDNQIFLMTDLDGGNLRSGDEVQFGARQNFPGKLALTLDGTTVITDDASDWVRIERADGTSGAIGPTDKVVFRYGQDVMKFIPVTLDTQQVCTKPDDSGEGHHAPLPLQCHPEPIMGGRLAVGPATSDAAEYTFQIGYAFSREAFTKSRFWVDQDLTTDRERWEKFSELAADPMFLVAEFHPNWARTWLDAMHASAEGAAYGAAAGGLIGACFGVVPIGAGMGSVFVGTISAAAAASNSLEAQKAQYLKKNAQENKAAWEAAREKERSPGFVGPVRSENPPTGYGEQG